MRDAMSMSSFKLCVSLMISALTSLTLVISMTHEDKNGKEKDTVHDQSVNEDSGDSLNEKNSDKERGS